MSCIRGLLIHALVRISLSDAGIERHRRRNIRFAARHITLLQFGEATHIERRVAVRVNRQYSIFVGDRACIVAKAIAGQTSILPRLHIVGFECDGLIEIRHRLRIARGAS